MGRAIISEISKHNGFEVYSTYFKNPTALNQEKSFRLDIADLDNLDKILNAIKPQIVISCLRGDFNKQLILHIKVAEYLKEICGKLYFCSTTNVFDKDFSRPHYEDDLPNSDTDYGLYKIKCEKKITEILHDNACILRLPGVWAKDSQKMKQLLKLLKDNGNVLVYPKLFINAITDKMIALKVIYIIEHNLNGIFHLVSEDVVNYKDFYIELINKLGFENVRVEENIDEKGYFALLSKRGNEFPERLKIASRSVISYLTDAII